MRTQHEALATHPLLQVSIRTALLLGLVTAALSFCSTTPSAAQTVDTAPQQPLFHIRPMTDVDEKAHTGYFGDPYPIHLSPWLAPFLPQYFSGTSPAVLTCELPVRPGCFSSTAITVVPSATLRENVQRAGNVFGAVINRNIYQDLRGEWQMAVTLYVHPANDPKTRWTVIAHAHPEERSLMPPSSWIADKVLVGSLATKDYANYDGKYYDDGRSLYLIYSKRLPLKDVAHDGIVAQLMKSATDLDTAPPVLLLAPANGEASLNSEYFHTVPSPADSFKLIETGNITKIAGKYVMAYSAGDYQQKDYKTGVAYSDTLIPSQGHTYRKVLETDAAGVWGQPGHAEVHYLLQSQKPEWPNYVAKQVIAPGVPSIVEQPDGRFLMFFDAFLPSDAPQAPDTPKNPLNIEPDHRRPFYVPLRVHVPGNGSVQGYTDSDLVTWIVPETEKQ